MTDLKPVQARVVSISPETPTIARVRLRVEDEGFTFAPGQWLDFGVQLGDVMEVGGYSFASDPRELPEFELGVRHNPKHPVSHWLHTAARPGDAVLIKGGQGACTWTPTPGEDVTFVVGGIGVTPPLSMLRAAIAGDTPFTARMFYSARTHDELAFLADLQALSEDPRLTLRLAVTREAPAEGASGERWRVDRVMEEDAPETIVYVFGPPPMVDAFCDGLAAAGVEGARVRTERWW